MMSDTTKTSQKTVGTETGRIEQDLDRTRARLGSHLSELQDRLSPGQVLDDLMGYFRGIGLPRTLSSRLRPKAAPSLPRK